MSEVIRVHRPEEFREKYDAGYTETIRDIEMFYRMNETKRIELLEGCPYVELSGSLQDDLRKEQESKPFVSIYNKPVRKYYNELEVFEYLVRTDALACSINEGPDLDREHILKYSSELLSLLGIAEPIKDMYLKDRYDYLEVVGSREYAVVYSENMNVPHPVYSAKDLYDGPKHRNEALRGLKRDSDYLKFYVGGSSLYCTGPMKAIPIIEATTV